MSSSRCRPVVFALLAAGCGSSSSEKVDAGHRRYCDAYCADSKQQLPGPARDSGENDGSTPTPDGLNYQKNSDLGPPVDSYVQPSPLDGAPFDTERSSVDTGSGLRGDSGAIGGSGGGNGGSGGSAGGGGTGGSSFADARGDTSDTMVDAPVDAPVDSGHDAVDSPPDVVRLDQALADVQPEVSSILDLASPDLADAGPPDALIPSDAAADMVVALDSASPTTCSAAQPDYAQVWPQGLQGAAYGSDGSLWTVGYFTRPFTIAGKSAAYTGQAFGADADTYLAKLDPVSGAPTVLQAFGQNAGSSGSTRRPASIAVAANGRVGIVGTFSSEIDFTALDSIGTVTAGNPDGLTGSAGLDYLVSSTTTNYWGIFDGTAAPVKNHRVDVGNGTLFSVATNATDSAFAICGKTSKLVPPSTSATGLLMGANSYGGGMDIVVAKIDTSGSVLWGRQFGGAGDQSCQSITMDSNGDVLIAGGYSGSLQFDALPAFPTQPDITASLLYIARLASGNGAALSAKTWGASGRIIPYGIKVDADSNIVVAGSMGGDIDFGGGISIPDLGLTDAFVVKFASDLSVVWAKGFGDAAYDQQARSVGFASNGDVYVSGLFVGGMGTMNLTSYSTDNTDAFIARLAGADGAVLCPHELGNSDGSQDSNSLVVAPAAAGALVDSVTMTGQFSSKLALDGSESAILDTGSATASSSYMLRLAH